MMIKFVHFYELHLLSPAGGVPWEPLRGRLPAGGHLLRRLPQEPIAQVLQHLQRVLWLRLLGDQRRQGG